MKARHAPARTSTRSSASASANVAGARDAGDRFQICVDREEVTISPVLILGPRHHLKQIAIEWSAETVCGDGRRAIWMEVVVVDTEPDRVMEFAERGAAL